MTIKCPLCIWTLTASQKNYLDFAKQKVANKEMPIKKNLQNGLAIILFDDLQVTTFVY